MEIRTLITFARNDDLLFFEISLVFRLSSLVFLLYLRNDTVQTTVFKENKSSAVSCIGAAFIASMGGCELHHPLLWSATAIAYQRTIYPFVA